MTTSQELIESIQICGLTNRMDKLLQLAKPAIQIQLTHVRDENEIRIGQSKMGGSPDLPMGVEWPYWDAKPLTFISQFRLEEIAAFDTLHELSSTGLLYFFYEANSQPWGFDPNDRKSGQVFFLETGSTPLTRVPHPTALGKFGEIKSLNPCAVQLSATLTLPSTDFFDLNVEYGFSEPEIEKYWNLLSAINRLETSLTRFRGYPDEIQSDMRLECQLASNGLYVGDSHGYNDPRRKELEKGAEDWELLLQVDSADDLGTIWGDVGHIYFWIKQQDLKARNFSNIWVVLQCT